MYMNIYIDVDIGIKIHIFTDTDSDTLRDKLHTMYTFTPNHVFLIVSSCGSNRGKHPPSSHRTLGLRHCLIESTRGDQLFLQGTVRQCEVVVPALRHALPQKKSITNVLRQSVPVGHFAQFLPLLGFVLPPLHVITIDGFVLSARTHSVHYIGASRVPPSHIRQNNGLRHTRTTSKTKPAYQKLHGCYLQRSPCTKFHQTSERRE